MKADKGKMKKYAAGGTSSSSSAAAALKAKRDAFRADQQAKIKADWEAKNPDYDYATRQMKPAAAAAFKAKQDAFRADQKAKQDAFKADQQAKVKADWQSKNPGRDYAAHQAEQARLQRNYANLRANPPPNMDPGARARLGIPAATPPIKKPTIVEGPQNKPVLSPQTKPTIQQPIKRPPLSSLGPNAKGPALISQTKPAGMRSGGSVSSASKRADGIATKGKTRGKFV